MIVGVNKTGYWSKLRPYFSKFGKISKFLSTLQILMEQLQIWRADDLAFGKLILEEIWKIQISPKAKTARI